MGVVKEIMDYSKITHNMNPGDAVRVKGTKATAKIADLTPMQHWENCVTLDKPLQGWVHWDATELEKVDGISKR